jgi:choline monooxygenase
VHPFTIHPDIAQAHTPPADFYSDPEVLARFRQNVFRRTWQFFADTDVVKSPGQVYPSPLLEGVLDDPIVLTRDMNDRVHCLANVCTHRGNLVCEGAGTERSLRCRYHGRRFELSGKFHSMPEFEGAVNFPTEDDSLPQVPLAKYARFCFVSIDPIAPLEEVFMEMNARVGFLPVEQFVHDPSRGREYLMRGNWALYVDNYLEGFHIPYIHASLNAQLDYDSYSTELLKHGVLQVGYADDASVAFDLPKGHPDAGRRIGAYYYWFFPNLMMNFYPWGLSINVVRPLTVDTTKVSFINYVWKPELIGVGAGAGLDRVEREDESVVEATHRGLKSGLYKRGRYSPKRETGPHHFHRLAVAALWP